MTLSSEEEEIGPNTGKAAHVPQSLMSPYVEKGSFDLPTLHESRQVKRPATKKSLTVALAELRKAKLAQANERYEQFEREMKANIEELKLTWGTVTSAWSTAVQLQQLTQICWT